MQTRRRELALTSSMPEPSRRGEWRDDARFSGVRIHESSYVDEAVTICGDTS